VNTLDYIVKQLIRMLSFWLVQNLSFLLSVSIRFEEGFPTSGMTDHEK